MASRNGIHSLLVQAVKGKFWVLTLSHKMCPRKQITEPKWMIMVSFSLRRSYIPVIASTLLREVCRSVFFFWATLYRVSQKKGNPFYQWDIFIVAQVFIKLYASCSRTFSLLSFDTKHMTIPQRMTEKEQFELMHVRIELRRIMVLSWYDQVQTS